MSAAAANFSVAEFVLDPNAISIEAEYTRYLDPDILGKIILKNFAVNLLGLDSRHVRIPVSRHGDVGNYRDLCDAGIRIGSRWYAVETKCSRWILAKRSRIANPTPRWNFSKLLYSARSRQERLDYELLFAVGIDSPGLEDSDSYWRHLHALRKEHLSEGRPFDFTVWPHDKAFLGRCGFYIMPRSAVRLNQMDVTIRKIPHGKDDQFFAWGHDVDRLRQLWRYATRLVDVAP